MSEELKPCPFCGHDSPEFERLGDRRQSCIVACGNCGCRHESSDEGENNGSSWNDRAAPIQPYAWETSHPAVCVPITKDKPVADGWIANGWPVVALFAGAPAAQSSGEAVRLQHVAVCDEGELRWMTGIKPRDCELYAVKNNARIPLVLYTAPPAAPAEAKAGPAFVRDWSKVIRELPSRNNPPAPVSDADADFLLARIKDLRDFAGKAWACSSLAFTRSEAERTISRHDQMMKARAATGES